MNEIGELCILLSLGISIYSAIVPILGVKRGRDEYVASAENSLFVTAGLITISSAILTYAFLNRDFSIEYVANYSNRDLHLFYTVSAFWAGQKGSLLFWSLLLSLFAAVVVIQNKNKNRDFMPYVISTISLTLCLFLALLTFAARPFELIYPPEDGSGLNPMLQNPGMVFHPPTLYIGYVGFTIPYAFAMASLLTGHLGDVWIKTTRRWTIFSWFFLGMGNLFGAWWAYRTLGWGGYWAWDPVENASFMPWLTGTAFIHSVMIQERKRMLKVWNLVLITLTFSLVIFGTFLTRSGILGSVHAFADGPVGVMFLAFLALVLFFSFGLVAYRADRLKGHGELDSIVSRESAFLLNNVVLVGICFTVFLGTIFPLLAEAIRGTKMSVGTPYFNRVSVPLGMALLLLMGIGPLIAWGRASLNNLKRNFLKPSLAALAGGAILAALGVRQAEVLAAFVFCFFVIGTIVFEFMVGTRTRAKTTGERFLTAFATLLLKSRRRYGGLIVHLGVVVAIIGIAVSSVYKVEREQTLKPGETLSVGPYAVRFDGLAAGGRPTHILVWANLMAFKDGKPLHELRSEEHTSEL